MADPLFVVPTTITEYYDKKILTKRRGVLLKQGQTAYIRLTMLDSIGNSVDLSAYVPEGLSENEQVVGMFREVVGLSRNGCFDAQYGEVTDAETGEVVMPVPDLLTTVPGVFICEVGILNDAGRLHFSNTLYLYVERGLFQVTDPDAEFVVISGDSGPPTIDDIRLSIRDNGPEDNLLLDNFEFDIAEICSAAQRAVTYWNESQPPISVVFDTMSYPFREMWLRGIVGLLFQKAGSRHFRNDLAYSAGGINMADQNKWQQYLPLGKDLWNEYTTWVRQKKVQINAEAAIGSLGSTYGWFRNF